MSIRGDEWKKFAEMVYNHIENYTVPQYGDKGTDQVTNWSAADCMVAIGKYAGRYGNNARDGQQLLDFLKSAHYAQMGYDKEREHGDNPVQNKVVFRGKLFDLPLDMMRDLEDKKVTITVDE